MGKSRRAREQHYFRCKVPVWGGGAGVTAALGSVRIDGPYSNKGRQMAACTVTFDTVGYPANIDLPWSDPARLAAARAAPDWTANGGPLHPTPKIRETHLTSLAKEAIDRAAHRDPSYDASAGSPVALAKQRDRLDSGEYFPRVWRPRSTYFDDIGDLPQARLDAAVAMHRLESLLGDLFEVVWPEDRRNRRAFGHRTRELLMLACTEAENAWRAVLVANNYCPPTIKAKKASTAPRFTTRDYVKLKRPQKLERWSLRLAQYSKTPVLVPYGRWQTTRPTTSLPWYSAYNATKHNRGQEFSKASLWAAVEAVAATWVAYGAQFGPQWCTAESRYFAVLDHPFRTETEFGYIAPNAMHLAKSYMARNLPL